MLEQQEQTVFQRLRVVSGRETQKREKAAGTGCDLVLCAFVAVDRASVGKREPTTGAGFGCDNIGRALDNFIHQRGGVQVCDPGGMEGLSSTLYNFGKGIGDETLLE